MEYKIDIFNKAFTVKFLERTMDSRLDSAVGYCDYKQKEILIGICEDTFDHEDTIRHEIIHACLYACGLGFCTLDNERGWANNEEMVDWFAMQMPYIEKITQDIFNYYKYISEPKLVGTTNI